MLCLLQLRFILSGKCDEEDGRDPMLIVVKLSAASPLKLELGSMLLVTGGELCPSWRRSDGSRAEDWFASRLGERENQFMPAVQGKRKAGALFLCSTSRGVCSRLLQTGGVVIVITIAANPLLFRGRRKITTKTTEQHRLVIQKIALR